MDFQAMFTTFSAAAENNVFIMTMDAESQQVINPSAHIYSP